MFVTLKLLPKSKLLLYFSAKQEKINSINFYNVIASTPRNYKQWKKLNNLLMPAENNLVLPKDFFNENLTVSTFPTKPFCDKVLLQAFLRFCKTEKPTEVTIRPNGKLTNFYLLSVCRYVGRLIIIDAPKDTDFCKIALEKSGTPVVYSSSIVSATPCLDLGETRPFLPNSTYCFCENIFNKLAPPIFPFTEFFADLDQLCLSAAIDSQIKNHSYLQDAWIEVILNEY